MKTITAETSTWLARHSLEEREYLLRHLLVETLITRPNTIAVHNDCDEVLSYVVAGNSSADWMGLGDPAVAAEFKRRIENPGKSLTLEEVKADISNESSQAAKS